MMKNLMPPYRPGTGDKEGEKIKGMRFRLSQVTVGQRSQRREKQASC